MTAEESESRLGGEVPNVWGPIDSGRRKDPVIELKTIRNLDQVNDNAKASRLSPLPEYKFNTRGEVARLVG
jgi:hypothetical protein